MHPFLRKNLFLIKEHVGMFKASSNYDIFDLETGEELMMCREPHLGTIVKCLRFTDYKRMTPFDIHVTDFDEEPVLRIQRGISWFVSHVDILDEEDEFVGGFKQKYFSLGGAFNVLNADEEEVCTLKGKWSSWEFKFEHDGHELANVTKKWRGIGTEMFTSADNYVLSISDDVPPNNPIRYMILAAVLCIDMVLKE